MSSRLGGDGTGVGSMTGGFCRLVTDDGDLFSCSELIVRARTEPGENKDVSTGTEGEDGGRTISPLKRRPRNDGEVSRPCWLFAN